MVVVVVVVYNGLVTLNSVELGFADDNAMSIAEEFRSHGMNFNNAALDQPSNLFAFGLCMDPGDCMCK